MNINDYILEFEFEHLNDTMLQFNLKLPDNILCFMLLESAPLQNNEKQMALNPPPPFLISTTFLPKIFDPSTSCNFWEGQSPLYKGGDGGGGCTL